MRIDKIVWLGCVVLALTGCTAEQPPQSGSAATPVVPATPSKPPKVTDDAVKALAEPAVVDEMRTTETAQAQRLADAREYLDQARAAAQERLRLATLACETQGQGDRDACLAAAEDAMQADLQAARAEFEAQMRQPD